MPLEVRYDDCSIDIPENRLLRTAATRLLAHIILQRRSLEDAAGTSSANGFPFDMQTDIAWWSGTDCLAVIDAKYKRLGVQSALAPIRRAPASWKRR